MKNMLQRTSISKPTLTNTNNFSSTPTLIWEIDIYNIVSRADLLVMLIIITTMEAFIIWAVTGVLDCTCKRDRNLGRWFSREAAKQNLPLIKPAPSNEPKSERNTSSARGTPREDPATCEEKEDTIKDDVLISSVDKTKINALLTSK